MPVFEYKAMNRKGKSLGGLVTADGPSDAMRKLSRDDLFPVDIREVKTTKGRSAEALTRHLRFRRINPVAVTTALRQMATLISSGIPIVECLDGVIEQTEVASLKSVFTQIREKVVQGSSLAQSMAEHPAVFDEIHVNMVRAGETGGALDIVLIRLSDFAEGRVKMKKKVESALVYPAFLIMISSIILIFLMSFVMPKVIGIFEGMGLILPWSTRMLIGTTYFLKSSWWLLIIGAAAACGLVAAWVRTKKGELIWDRLRLRIPLVGGLHHKVVISRFSRTLSILLRSGIPLVNALEIGRQSMGNRVMEAALKDVAEMVAEGKDFASQLKGIGRFPPMVVQLIRAGEQSGHLEDMLAKAAEVYEDDVESNIAAITAMIEPMVILGMGTVVGFIVLAILLPIFDMAGGPR